MFFQENIYGNTAIVYHRTNVEDLINRVYTEGWQPGSGTFYGKGFYATYTLEAQLNDWMRETYGNIIVKFAVHGLENFFIFDYDEFKKSPNYKLLGKPLEYEYLQAQFKRFGIDYKKFKFNVKLALETIKNEYSSIVARWCYDNIPNFTYYVDGIIFTGEHDGKVLVSYQLHKNIVPISFTMDEGNTWLKVPVNKEHLKKLLLGPGTVRRTNISKIRHTPEEYDIFKYKFNKDGSIDVFESVNLSYSNFIELPFKFNIVDGNFIATDCNLKTLKGCPKEVKGNFVVGGNQISSLEYCPKIVYGYFSIYGNLIKKIDNIPIIGKFPDIEKTNYTYIFSNNPISYIEPNIFNKNKEIIGISLRNTKIKKVGLNGLPKVLRSLDASLNELKFIRTDEPFEEILNEFNVHKNNLVNLIGAPKKVGGDFDVSNNNTLRSLKGISKYIGGVLNLNHCSNLKKIEKENLPDYVGKGVFFYFSGIEEKYLNGYRAYNEMPFDEFKKLVFKED